jgi:hypothetical protein
MGGACFSLMPLVFSKYCCKPGKVGRTPWSARVPLDPFFVNGSSLMDHTGIAGQGAGRGPGGPPYF